MLEKYKSLLENIMLFSLNNFLPRVLTFFMLPIYTKYLTTTEYGVFDLMSSTILLLLPIFTLDIQDAVMRFGFGDEYLKKHIFSASCFIIFLGSVILGLGIYIVDKLSIFSVNGIDFFVFFLIYVFTAYSNSISMFCRGINRVQAVVEGSSINSFLFAISNLILIIKLDFGLYGYLISTVISQAVFIIYIFLRVKLYKYICYNIPEKVFKDMLMFSSPLVFNVIGWWINNVSDRYIITYFLGISASGLFAVAYKLPSILTILQNIFSQAWSISAIKDFDKNDSDGYIGKIYMMMSGVMSIACSILIIFNIPISYTLFSNKFFYAYLYTPPLLLSVVFNAMSLFIGSVFTAVKDTTTLSITTIAGAIVNIICNVIFIYYWQAYGAAIATAVGYLVVFVIRARTLRKHIVIKVNWKREILIILLLFIQMTFAYYGNRMIAYQILILTIILSMYIMDFKLFVTMLINKEFKI